MASSGYLFIWYQVGIYFIIKRQSLRDNEKYRDVRRRLIFKKIAIITYEHKSSFNCRVISNEQARYFDKYLNVSSEIQ